MAEQTLRVEYRLRVLSPGIENEPKELVSLDLQGPLMPISVGDTIWPEGLQPKGLENRPDPLLYRKKLRVARIHHSMSRFENENPPVLRHTLELHVDDQEKFEG